MKTIVVATDFSTLANNALDYAAAIAQSIQGKLILFNAYSVPVPGANGLLSPAGFDELLADNQKRLENKAKVITETLAIEVVCETSYSSVIDELGKLVAKYQADLVVLGMEPDSTGQALFGNTTTAVTGKLGCLMLAVPGTAKFNGLHKIVFACDAAQEVPAPLLQTVKAIAEVFHSEVEVFFAEGEANALPGVESLMAKELAGVTYTYKKVRAEAVSQAIRQEILADEADLLIMAPKTHGFWSSLVHPSKTRKLASGLNIPMLTISA